MKTYENDGNVDYEDLRGGGISEVKGYGPCDTCKEPDRWMKFEMACPACSNRSTGSWYHDKDGCRGSYMEMSNKGILKCYKCSLALNMANWRFDCSAHGGGYRAMNEDSWRKAMGIALTLPKADRLTNQVVMELNRFVTNHPEKFGFSGY